jgi:hypothetical protein
MKITEIQRLRFVLAREEEDLRRFLADPRTPTDSIATTKRNIEKIERQIALYTG